jgi:hypothetical protein
MRPFLLARKLDRIDHTTPRTISPSISRPIETQKKKAMGIVCGAVERVDDPFKRKLFAATVAFFREYLVVRELLILSQRSFSRTGDPRW